MPRLTASGASHRVRAGSADRARQKPYLAAFNSSCSGEHPAMKTADIAALEKTIEQAFENRDSITAETRGEVREAVETAQDLLDSGSVREAERRENGQWHVNQWLKKAVLLSFRLNPMQRSEEHTSELQ